MAATLLLASNYRDRRMLVNLDRILAELRSERDRLEKAIAALEAIGQTAVPSRGRIGRPRKKRSRRLTPEGRKRLSDMMKKRWAERRKKAKVA